MASGQPNAAAAAPAPIVVDTIVVRTGRLVCTVVVADPRLRYTTPELVERVMGDHPSLARHACVNAEGPRFADVMDHTSLPHLLEHVAIDMQTRRARTDDAIFVGTTEWIDESAGQARIQLSFADDLEGLRSFRDAVSYLNAVVLT